MSEAELNLVAIWSLAVAGLILMIWGAYGWYCQKKRIEWMDLEGKKE